MTANPTCFVKYGYWTGGFSQAENPQVVEERTGSCWCCKELAGGRERGLIFIRLAIEEGNYDCKASGTSAFAACIIFTVADRKR